jgi:hypothetical protein
MVESFSVVYAAIVGRGDTPRIIETGSGFSTIVLSRLISGEGELVSIDLGGLEAFTRNTRSDREIMPTSARFVPAPTISLQQLEKVWEVLDALAGVSLTACLDEIDLFVDFSQDDRRVMNNITSRLLNGPLTANALREYLIRVGLINNELLNSYRCSGDEFDALAQTTIEPVLEQLIADFDPNLIYLDSGEYSTFVEFQIVDRTCKSGMFLIVQDVLFPKSIKGFLISCALIASPRWDVVWVDKSTPQGVVIAVRN